MAYHDYYYYFLLLDETPPTELTKPPRIKKGSTVKVNYNGQNENMNAFEYFIMMHSTYQSQIRWWHPVFSLLIDYLADRSSLFEETCVCGNWRSLSVSFECIITPAAIKEYIYKRSRNLLCIEDYCEWLCEIEAEILSDGAEDLESFMECLDEQFSELVQLNQEILLISSQREMVFDMVWEKK
jgi:hypothetical protein